MKRKKQHGGAGRNQGRHNKWDPYFEYLVFYECERLVRETLLSMIAKQKDTAFIWETDLDIYWKYINAIPVNRRTEFLKNEANEIHLENIKYEVDTLKSSKERLDQSSAIINLNAYLPWGAQSKIKREVAEKYDITPEQVEYIWKKTKPV